MNLKKFFLVFLSVLLLNLPFLTSNVNKMPTAQAAGWEKVTTNFGDPGITVSAPVEFKGKLYVASAKLNNGRLFTEIWRTNGGANPTWTKVVTDGLTGNVADPGNSAVAMAMKVFNNELYLTSDMETTNRDICQISNGNVVDPSCQFAWKSADGQIWVPAAPNNFKGVSLSSSEEKTGITLRADNGAFSNLTSGDMIEFQDSLYVDTAKYHAANLSDCTRGEIFKTDGTNWTKAYVATNPNQGIGGDLTCAILSMAEYRGSLYASTRKYTTQNKPSEIWRTDDGQSWSSVMTDSFGEGAIVTNMAVFNDELYAATQYTDNRPAGLWKFNGTDWSHPINNGFGDANNKAVTSLENFGGSQLVVASYNPTEGTQILHSSDGVSWTELNTNGFGDSRNVSIGGLTVFSGDSKVYATVWNNNTGGMQVWRSDLIEPPPPQCAIDLLIVLDVSGSMRQPFINGNGETKLHAAKRSIAGANGVLRALNNKGSRVALLTFTHFDQQFQLKSVFNANGSDYQEVTDESLLNMLIPDVNNIDEQYYSRKDGGTPLATATERARLMVNSRGSDGKYPVVLFVSDGSPTIDLAGNIYDNHDTDVIHELRPDGKSFYSEDYVRTSGEHLKYINYKPPAEGRYAGYPAADTMNRGKAMRDGIQGGFSMYSIFLQVQEGMGVSNVDILKYLGSLGGGQLPNFNTFVPDDLDQLQNSFLQIVQLEACKAKMTLDLPPKSIFTPDKLEFGGNSYTFNLQTNQFDQTGGTQPYNIDVQEQFVDASGKLNFYRVTIKDFSRGAGPNVNGLFRYKMTYRNQANAAALSDLVNYLAANHNDKPDAFLADEGCATRSTNGQFICFKTYSSLHVPTPINSRTFIQDSNLSYAEKVERKGLIVEGNVAAPRNISGFTLDPNSIAVGGTVSVEGGTDLANYISQQTTTFNWRNVSGQVQDMLNRGKLIGSPAQIIGGNYGGSTWNLNAASRDPGDTTSNSFSSPPEGKIWYYNGPLSFNAPNLAFTGAGTIVVNGNVTVNGTISCGLPNSTRLAIIANGSITINTNHINCGAFVAAGGALTLANASDGNIQGILIARDSVRLPNPNQLSGTYFIHYDSYLASHPTGLIQELLKIVFGTTS